MKKRSSSKVSNLCFHNLNSSSFVALNSEAYSTTLIIVPIRSHSRFPGATRNKMSDGSGRWSRRNYVPMQSRLSGWRFFYLRLASLHVRLRQETAGSFGFDSNSRALFFKVLNLFFFVTAAFLFFASFKFPLLTLTLPTLPFQPDSFYAFASHTQIGNVCCF